MTEFKIYTTNVTGGYQTCPSDIRLQKAYSTNYKVKNTYKLSTILLSENIVKTSFGGSNILK